MLQHLTSGGALACALHAELDPTPVRSCADVQLLEGDCLDVMRTMPAGSIDAVITDPPYGIDYQSSRRTDPSKRLRKIAGDGQPFVWFLPEAFRLLKDGGAILCFCRWDVAEPFRLALQWSGFTVRSQVIWDRLHHGMGDLKASFGPQHDTIWFATKGRFAFPDKRPVSVVRSQRLGGDALTHPTEKPVDLMRQLVRSVTPAGGTVLDPFAGSGSTLQAAVEEGRSAIGIELDADYAALSRRRLGLDRE